MSWDLGDEPQLTTHLCVRVPGCSPPGSLTHCLGSGGAPGAQRCARSEGWGSVLRLPQSALLWVQGLGGRPLGSPHAGLQVERLSGEELT